MTVSYFTSVILKTTIFTTSSQRETLYELKYTTFSLASKTEVGIGLEIIVKVKNRNGADTRDIVHKVAKIFRNDLSKRLNTYIDNITVETRHI